MRTHHLLSAILALFVTAAGLAGTVHAAGVKKRIAVISSYHREYLWSQDTNRGVVAALLEFGYLDDAMQGEEYTRNDYVESSHALILKLWMDTKRKNSKAELKRAVARTVACP